MKNSKYKQLGISNLYVIGCGLFILIMLCLFLLNFSKHIKIMKGYSYSDLKKSYPVISENNTYEFMNKTLFKSNDKVLDTLDFTKLNCFSLKHSSDLRSFISSVNDSLLSNSDKKFMRKQLSNSIYLWDKQKLNTVWCLTPKDLAKINLSDTTDYWEEFRTNFGNYGHHRYSKPLFNKEKNICIIEHSGSGGWETGSGEILLFKKIEGVWTFTLERQLWIS